MTYTRLTEEQARSLAIWLFGDEPKVTHPYGSIGDMYYDALIGEYERRGWFEDPENEGMDSDDPLHPFNSASEDASAATGELDEERDHPCFYVKHLEGDPRLGIGACFAEGTPFQGHVELICVIPINVGTDAEMAPWVRAYQLIDHSSCAELEILAIRDGRLLSVSAEMRDFTPEGVPVTEIPLHVLGQGREGLVERMAEGALLERIEELDDQLSHAHYMLRMYEEAPDMELPVRHKRRTRDEAVKWLSVYLRDGKWHRADHERAKFWSQSTITKARKDLGVEAKRMWPSELGGTEDDDRAAGRWDGKRGNRMPWYWRLTERVS